MRRIAKNIWIFTISRRATSGWLVVGSIAVPCRLGKNGARFHKREGDGASPVGDWRTTGLLYRPDRLRRPLSALSVRALRPRDGWCDDSGDRNYNRAVKLPYAASHETLCRDDHLYDIVVLLSHNVQPRVKGLGSAVFFHLAADGPTAGCIAISKEDMLKILPRCGAGTFLRFRRN